MRNQNRANILIAALAVLLLGPSASGQLLVMENSVSRHVFGAGTRAISVVISNRSDKPVTMEGRTALVQAGGATAIRLANNPWKKLQLLPGQTVVETASIAFPEVKAKSQFIVQWIADTNKVIGTTTIQVYSQKLLSPLKSLVGESPLGLVDPGNQIKPLLAGLNLEILDLQNSGFADFPGKLAIIGPIQGQDQQIEGLAEKINALSKRGVAVVWIQSEVKKQDKLLPSFYSVLQNSGAVVIVQPELFLNPSENPQAQLNLVRFCQLALRPEPLDLPIPDPHF